MFSWKRFSRVCNLYTLENYTPNDAFSNLSCLLSTSSRPVAGLKMEKPCIGGRMKDLFHKNGATSKAAKVNRAWQSKDVTSGSFQRRKVCIKMQLPKKIFNTQMLHVWNIYLHLDQIYGMQVNYSMHAAYGMLFLQGLIVILCFHMIPWQHVLKLPAENR